MSGAGKHKVTLLAGGVGGAKMAEGLAALPDVATVGDRQRGG